MYVDDSKQKTNNLVKGMRYDVNKKRVEITQEENEEDDRKLQKG